MKLEDALQECTLALLRKIAAAHDVPVEVDTLRAELADRISQRFAGLGYLSGYVARLPDGEKEVLRFLKEHDWVGKAFLLERQFARPEDADGNRPNSLTIALLQMGLIYRSFGTIASWHGELYHVPVELRDAVSVSLPRGTGPARPAVTASVVPERVEQWNPAFDMFCLLSFLRRGEHRSNQGFISRFDLPKLEQEAGRGGRDLGGGEAERQWRFLLHLALSSGWVRRDGPVLKPGRASTQMLSGRPGEVRQRILDRYVKDRSWSDLAEAGRVRQSLGSRRIDETAARQAVLHYLQEFTDGEWVNEAGFCEAVRGTNPDFLREDYASLGSAVVDMAAEAELSGAESWEPVEGEWIRYVLRGPLYWLGVVRWGRDSTGRRVALQLVPDVASRDEGPLLSGGSRQVVFRDDLTVHAPEGVDLGLLYQIEPYFTLRGRDESGSSYRISRSSVLRGLEGGGSSDELRGLMGQVWVQIPQAVLQQVREWTDSYGRLVIEGGVLLTALRDEEAEAIAESPTLRSYLGTQLGSRTFRVMPERVWQLVDALREAGYAPRVDSSVGAQGIRAAAADVAALRESLFALLVLHSLHGQLDLGDGAEAQRRLEAALGPDNVEEVAKRAQEAVKRLRGRGDTGNW